MNFPVTHPKVYSTFHIHANPINTQTWLEDPQVAQPLHGPIPVNSVRIQVLQEREREREREREHQQLNTCHGQ